MVDRKEEMLTFAPAEDILMVLVLVGFIVTLVMASSSIEEDIVM
jgi:hypothetical protein